MSTNDPIAEDMQRAYQELDIDLQHAGQVIQELEQQLEAIVKQYPDTDSADTAKNALSVVRGLNEEGLSQPDSGTSFTAPVPSHRE